MDTINQIIEKYNMKKHPEGGYYSEVFRSTTKIIECTNPSMNKHSACTSIYYLLTAKEHSNFHLIAQEETWHYYHGGTVLLHLISPSGKYKLVRLGRNLLTDDFQFTVPAKWLMAAEIIGDYCLVGCTVAPGFEFADFTMPSRTELLAKFPELEDIITRMSK